MILPFYLPSNSKVNKSVLLFEDRTLPTEHGLASPSPSVLCSLLGLQALATTFSFLNVLLEIRSFKGSFASVCICLL